MFWFWIDQNFINILRVNGEGGGRPIVADFWVSDLTVFLQIISVLGVYRNGWTIKSISQLCRERKNRFKKKSHVLGDGVLPYIESYSNRQIF